MIEVDFDTFDMRLIKFVDIDKIEEVGLVNMVDIEVEDDHTFCLADGIVSHNSARNSIQSARGKNRLIGSFSLRGKPLNVFDAEVKDVIANSEFANMLTITGLQLGEEVKADPDGEWVTIDLNGKEFLVNSNDTIKDGDKLIKIKDLLK